MDVLTALLSFSLAASLLTITPGLDTALVLRTAVVEGRHNAFQAAIGICVGVLCWGILASMGIGALEKWFPQIHAWLQVAGALYLGWLGLNMLRSAASKEDMSTVSSHSCNAPNYPPKAGSWLAKGFFTNLLNPKVGLFYISFLPQFTPPTVNAAAFGILLASMHVAMGIVWDTVIIISADNFATRLASPRFRRTLDGITGSVLVFFATKLFFSKTV